MLGKFRNENYKTIFASIFKLSCNRTIVDLLLRHKKTCYPKPQHKHSFNCEALNLRLMRSKPMTKVMLISIAITHQHYCSSLSLSLSLSISLIKNNRSIIKFKIEFIKCQNSDQCFDDLDSKLSSRFRLNIICLVKTNCVKISSRYQLLQN